jgi:hypothetical protein
LITSIHRIAALATLIRRGVLRLRVIGIDLTKSGFQLPAVAHLAQVLERDPLLAANSLERRRRAEVPQTLPEPNWDSHPTHLLPAPVALLP